jgi:hypothetical protein
VLLVVVVVGFGRSGIGKPWHTAGPKSPCVGPTAHAISSGWRMPDVHL